MKIVSSCQGNNLTILLRLLELIETERSVCKTGIYVSDSMAFDKQTQSKIINSNMTVIKEWEIFAQGKNIIPDWDILKKYEERIGDPVLWNVLLSDRRVFFGRKCKMRQDYESRFSYDEMAGILQKSLEIIDIFFDDIKPDLVISFGASNVGDYIFYLLAKANNIPFLQLKATKIKNRVSFNDDIIELSNHIKKRYDSELVFDGPVLAEAKEYFETVEKTGAKYEGAILHREKVRPLNICFSLIKGMYASARKILNTTYRTDNHLEPFFLNQLHEKVLNPIKYYYQCKVLRKNILTFDQLAEQDKFAFYPLHFEPEVSMQVVGRPYQNQIELVRNIARNLPVGMNLIVKEHPRSKGFRRLSYYKKLLKISNVRLVNTDIPTNIVVKKAALVTVISGSTGLEAAIIGRPVITFGVPVYNMLPNFMVRHCTDLNNLGWDVRKMLLGYEKDQNKLEKYICATIDGSVPVDLYTVLLGKSGRYNANGAMQDKVKQREDEYKSLAKYLNLRINQELVNCSK